MKALSVMPKKPHYAAGFSLVELSIVLVIVGLIAGSSITAMNSQMAAAKKNQTIAKMQAIEQAIAAFLAINNRIPCPGISGASVSDPNFGLEYCTGSASIQMGGTPPGFETTTGDTWIISGAVPTKALQLPDEFIVDGWGNRFTYIVTEALAGGHSDVPGPPSNNVTFDDTTEGLITVRDGTTDTISIPVPNISSALGETKVKKIQVDGMRTNQAVYVLMSHGANGFGAWLHDGNDQRPPSTNRDELDNGPLAGPSGGFDHMVVQREANAKFDDIVDFKMKWQLTREAGALVSSVNCETATSIINQQISCAANSMPDCNSYLLALANQVNKWCIQQ